MTQQTKKRLEVLYKKHHKWLYSTIFKITQDPTTSEELVGELYLYLGEKDNKHLYYNDSFNLMYCRSFLQSRYYNLYKRNKKLELTDEDLDIEDIEYDYEEDKMLETKYDEVMDTIQGLSKTDMWASAAIYQLYALTDQTIEEVSKDIGISPSTTFKHIKRIREYLKDTIRTPFT
jgi:RNA polymerase sigma factor (sigma-70 family)